MTTKDQHAATGLLEDQCDQTDQDQTEKYSSLIMVHIHGSCLFPLNVFTSSLPAPRNVWGSLWSYQVLAGTISEDNGAYLVRQ